MVTTEKKATAIKKPTADKKATAIKKPTTEKKTPATDKKTPAADAKKKEDAPKKLTQGQKLLQAMTAQKAAKQALAKGVTKTHVTFDDEGNGNSETIVQKATKARPAMKKPEPKKRKAPEGETKEQESKEEVKVVKKQKKPKKSKAQIQEEKKDNKQEEALAYVHLFVNDRESWKFKKVQQIWLLANLYTIPEKDFDNVLAYIKDLQGTARENTKKEAESKIPVKKEIQNTLTGYSNVNTANDFDDFDAEKLLAQATIAPPPTTVEDEEEEESDDVKRARQILKVLG